MTDQLILDIDSEEKAKLEFLAQRRGFDSMSDYVRALIQADAEIEKMNPIQGLQQGLREALRGEGLTEEEFWKALRSDE